MSISKEKLQAIEALVSKTDKEYGRGTMQFGKREIVPCPTVCSSGSLELDVALGVMGIPKGRVIEIYGPESGGKTTLTLHVIKECQKIGGVSAFIDMEHALDPVWASKLGVNMDELITSQPDCAQDALSLIEDYALSGVVDIIVLDSVSALVPQEEINGEMGDSHMGLQARLMSQALRKLTPIVSKSNCTVIFINQIRHKIGVMFGCFHYDARVMLSDGTTEKIGKIVKNKMPVSVLSYNFKTKKIEPRKILNWFNNGKANKFYQYVVEYPHGGGRSQLPIGDNHVLYTPDGEEDSKDLKIGDKILVKSYEYLTEEQFAYVVGMYLGDGSLRTKNGNTTQLRVKHSEKQNSYCKWKLNLLPKDFIRSQGYDKKNQYGFETKSSYELTKLISFGKKKKGININNELLNYITLKSIAIWYLDDGTFGGSTKNYGKGKCSISAYSMSMESKKLLAEHFVKLGLPKPDVSVKGLIYNKSEDSYLFHKIISRYTPSCMNYKIHKDFHNTLKEETIDNSNTVKEILIPVKIVDIYEKPFNSKINKFDIEVEQNHNYFVDNVLVHNSPETTTGGNALKFYASIRMDVRNASGDKDISEEFGQKSKKIKVKIVKNKVAPPFTVAELTLNTNEEENEYGFSQYEELLNLCVKKELIKKAGAWYSYGDEKIGQGANSAIQWLKANPEIYKTLREKVTSIFLEKGKELRENAMDIAIQEAVETNSGKKRRREGREEGVRDVEINIVNSEEVSE